MADTLVPASPATPAPDTATVGHRPGTVPKVAARGRPAGDDRPHPARRRPPNRSPPRLRHRPRRLGPRPRRRRRPRARLGQAALHHPLGTASSSPWTPARASPRPASAGSSSCATAASSATPWCGAPIRHTDHVVPHDADGPTAEANLRASANLQPRRAGPRLARPTNATPATADTRGRDHCRTGHRHTSTAPLHHPVARDSSLLDLAITALLGTMAERARRAPRPAGGATRSLGRAGPA